MLPRMRQSGWMRRVYLRQQWRRPIWRVLLLEECDQQHSERYIDHCCGPEARPTSCLYRRLCDVVHQFIDIANPSGEYDIVELHYCCHFIISIFHYCVFILNIHGDLDIGIVYAHFFVSRLWFEQRKLVFHVNFLISRLWFEQRELVSYTNFLVSRLWFEQRKLLSYTNFLVSRLWYQ